MGVGGGGGGREGGGGAWGEGRGGGSPHISLCKDYPGYGFLSPRFLPRWLSGLSRSHVQSLMIARRSLYPEKLGSNPGQGSKGINFSGWHGLDMSVTKRR